MGIAQFPAPSTGAETYSVSAPYTFNGNPTATIAIPAGTYSTVASPAGMTLVSGTNVLGGNTPGISVLGSNLSSVAAYDFFNLPASRGNIFGTSGSANKIIFAGGQFVAVGTDAGGNTRVLTSTDSYTWTARTNPWGSSFQPTQIAYGAGVYVVVGTGGAIMSSPDGITWTSRTSGTSNGLNGVTFGASTFVIGGNGGLIITSSDGITWNNRGAIFSTNNVQFVTFGNGVFVGGATSNDLRTSTNGISWTTRTGLAGFTYTSGGFGNGLLLIGGTLSGGAAGLLTSTDGITWTSRDTGLTSQIAHVTYNNNLYFAFGNNTANQMAISTNGTTWQLRPTNTGTASPVWSAFGNGFYVIISGSQALGTTFPNGTITLTRVSSAVTAG
jgi:hypothetical protein